MSLRIAAACLCAAFLTGCAALNRALVLPGDLESVSEAAAEVVLELGYPLLPAQTYSDGAGARVRGQKVIEIDSGTQNTSKVVSFILNKDSDKAAARYWQFLTVEIKPRAGAAGREMRLNIDGGETTFDQAGRSRRTASLTNTDKDEILARIRAKLAAAPGRP